MVILLVFVFISTNKNFKDNELIEYVTKDFMSNNQNLHCFVIDTGNLILEKYINKPKPG